MCEVSENTVVLNDTLRKSRQLVNYVCGNALTANSDLMSELGSAVVQLQTFALYLLSILFKAM